MLRARETLASKTQKAKNRAALLSAFGARKKPEGLVIGTLNANTVGIVVWVDGRAREEGGGRRKKMERKERGREGKGREGGEDGRGTAARQS